MQIAFKNSKQITEIIPTYVRVWGIILEKNSYQESKLVEG